MNEIKTGLVLSMTGLVIGLGPKMTRVTGPTTGLGVLRIGGVLSNRVLAHCQVQQALPMSRRIPPRVNRPRTLRL